MSDQLFNLLKGIFHIGNSETMLEQREAQISDLRDQLSSVEKRLSETEHVILEQNRTIGALALIQSSMLKEMERLLIPNKAKVKVRMPVTSSRDDDLIN